MDFKAISIESTIEERIVWAKMCLQEKKELLLGETITDELLKRFKKKQRKFPIGKWPGQAFSMNAVSIKRGKGVILQGRFGEP